MKRYVIAALAVGFLSGWFVRSLVLGSLASISPGDVLIAIVTISVGWWIERTVRRQEELDRIPIEAVSKLCDRLDALIVQCIESAAASKPTDAVLVQPLRFLANEVTWLGTVVHALDTAKAEHQRLQDQSHTFKVLLTRGPEVEANAAAEVGRNMRARIVQIRWMLCKRILARQAGGHWRFGRPELIVDGASAK